MKLELKMLEANDSSVASIWKKKCLDLFEVCQSIKLENDELRDRCKELIEQGITLANAISQGQLQQPLNESLLPKVNPTGNKLANRDNIIRGPGRGQLASTANTFQRSIYYGETPERESFNYAKEQTDHYEHLPSSAPWGVKSPETRHVHQPVHQIGYQT